MRYVKQFLVIMGCFLATITHAAQANENSRTFTKMTCMPELNYLEITTVGIQVDDPAQITTKLKKKYQLADEVSCKISGKDYKLALVSEPNPPKVNLHTRDRCKFDPARDLQIWRDGELITTVKKFSTECDYIGIPLLVIDQWHNMMHCSQLPGTPVRCKTVIIHKNK